MPDLTDALDELDQLLSELPNADEAFLLTEVDALIAGVLLSPEPVPLEQWLSLVWGGQVEDFARDSQQHARLIALIQERKTEMVGAFLQGGMAYMPVYDYDADDSPLWEIWIDSFAIGAALQPPGLVSLVESDDEDLATAVGGLAMLVGLSNGVKMPRQMREMLAETAPDMIPYYVETVYRRQRGMPRIIITN
jgi:uncharacterized protein